MAPFTVPIDAQLACSSIPVRVRFYETDLMGIVHHASYLAYFEVARVEWLRRRGVAYADWAAHGIHLPVVDVDLRYRAPARFDDLLVVETTLHELRVATVRFSYRVTRNGELLVEGGTRLACANDTMGVRRFPESVTEVLLRGEIPGAAREP